MTTPTKRRRLAAALLLTTVLTAGCGGTSATAELETAIELVAPTAAAEVLTERAPEVVLLDVRTPDEYNQGHVAGSVNIDFYAADFAQQLDALPKDVPYVVYCRSGNRSGSTMGIMEGLGFTEVWDVDGGIVAWAEAGLPIQR